MSKDFNPEEEQKASSVYADMLGLPRWEPGSRHPRMSLRSRSAQFAPFAALVGYDEMVDEEARQTEEHIEMAEEQVERLNRKMRIISDALSAGRHPELAFTFFVPDEKKAGGRYVSVCARPRRIDPAHGRIYLMSENGKDIPEYIQMDRLISIRGTLVECMEDPEAADYSE